MNDNAIHNRRIGTFGQVTCTSFFPAKPLGCYGDGGAVLTDDDALADALRSLRVHGQGSDKYDNVRIGLASRLDTIQAAVLNEKLKIFPDEIEARNRIARRYARGLADVTTVPTVPEGYLSVWAQYTIRIAGGREVHLRSLQPLGLYPANSLFIGDYLTTAGQEAKADLEMIRDAGFVLEAPDGTPLQGDPLAGLDDYLAAMPAVGYAAVEGPHGS